MKNLKSVLCILLAVLLVAASACKTEESRTQESTAPEETSESQTKYEEPEKSASGNAEESAEETEEKTWTVETQPIAEPGTAEAEEIPEENMERLYDSGSLGVDSQSYCVLDDAGNVVIGRKELKAYAPASITKVLTALVVMDHAELSDQVTIQESSLVNNMEPMSSGVYPSFKPLEVVTIEDLLYALILASTNAAGNILADHIAGNTPAFAELMNQKCAELGLTHSHFVNAHGLDTEGHYTCAYDMAMILKKALENETLRIILSSTGYKIPATAYTEERIVTMGHQMVNGTRAVAGVFAGKPGWTVNAQGTLLTAVTRGERTFYVCTMHSDNGCQYDDTTNVIEYAYAMAEGREPVVNPLIHNMVIRKSNEHGVDLFFVVDNGGSNVRVVYWDFKKGTDGAVQGEPTDAKPYMGVHFNFEEQGPYAVQIFATGPSGAEAGIQFYILFNGKMNKPGITVWNRQQYMIDDFGLLKCNGGVEVRQGIYYSNPDGSIAHGFCGRFYAGEDGQLVTGWVTAEGVTCYCQGDGRLATGRVVVEGVEHEFNEYGALIR